LQQQPQLQVRTGQQEQRLILEVKVQGVLHCRQGTADELRTLAPQLATTLLLQR
jgi:hypothetical protein